MKKNTIIIVLAVLVAMFGLYGFAQKVKADKETEESKSFELIANQKRDFATAALNDVREIRALIVEERERADSLQQQLDKCK